LLLRDLRARVLLEQLVYVVAAERDDAGHALQAQAYLRARPSERWVEGLLHHLQVDGVVVEGGIVRTHLLEVRERIRLSGGQRLISQRLQQRGGDRPRPSGCSQRLRAGRFERRLDKLAGKRHRRRVETRRQRRGGDRNGLADRLRARRDRNSRGR